MRLIAIFILSVFFCVAFAEDEYTNKVLTNGKDRFVFGQISSMRKDQYMLDTQTGRIWRIVLAADSTNSESGRLLLEPIVYVNIETGGVCQVPPNISIGKQP